MKLALHWQVTVAILLAVLVGWGVQKTSPGGHVGIKASELPAALEGQFEGLLVRSVGGPAAATTLRTGDVLLEFDGIRVTGPDQLDELMAGVEHGDRIRLRFARIEPWETVEMERELSVGIAPDSSRAKWIAPFKFGGDIFLRLLQMLIVPLILTSIVCGVAGVGPSANVGRLFSKTFGYYVCTSSSSIYLAIM